MAESLRPRLAKMAGYYARRSGEDADDLLQEAWVGALEALRRLELGIGDPEQYLIQCARWRLLDSIKHARIRRHASLDAECDDGTCIFGIESDPFSQYPLQHRLDEITVAEFTRHLKPVQRAVIFCLLNGLTWREAGCRLGCTSANIAYHVRMIRKEYEKWNEEAVLPGL